MRKHALIACAIRAALLFPCTAAHALQFDTGLSASDAKEIYNYTLSMDKIQKVAAASSSLQELGKHHPEMDNVQQSRSIDGMVENIKRYPEAVAAINRAGLTPREYVVCLMTVMQTSIAVGFKKSGTFKEYPPKLLQQVSRANLDFTEQHWDEIRKLMPGGDSDGE
jgi:hypothetical protein